MTAIILQYKVNIDVINVENMQILIINQKSRFQMFEENIRPMVKNNNLYPEHPEKYDKILCINQLMRQLEDEEKGMENPLFSKYQRAGATNIQITCKYGFCKAFLRYKLNEQNIYQLQNANNEHNHLINEKISRSANVNKKNASLDYRLNTLYITEQMQSFYRRYYRCMYLTITKAKSYSMICFSCSLPNKDIGIFAIALMKKPTQKNIRIILEEFSRRKVLKPQTIVCNHAHFAEIARHFYPTTNFILIDQQISQNYKVRYGFTKLAQLVTSQADWEKEHRKLVTYVRDCISPSEIKDVFLNYRKLCLPFLPSTFVGLGVQLFHGLLIEQTSQQNIYFTDDINKFLINFPHKIKTCFHDVQMKDFIEKIGVSNNNLLVDVYMELEESVVRYLVNQQNRTFFCDLNARPTGQFEVKYKVNSYSIVDKNTESGLWECDCGLKKKTGLPCCHIMKILLVLEQELRQYIDPYWLPQKKEKMNNEFELK